MGCKDCITIGEMVQDYGFNRNIMGCKGDIQQIVDARIKDLIGT